ncbi:hypothetical protein Pcinc_033270 [Petrolisthes cinctipes]|uniref:Uncharacterized protein n=1 Tax=Petrolisthes cinctipes TaxID=88211 RepID=A0AAE1JZN8_PETCI|nr:hypothetical protein Pcinc_033270 [Petrolisthes cinctipes]
MEEEGKEVFREELYEEGETEGRYVWEERGVERRNKEVEREEWGEKKLAGHGCKLLEHVYRDEASGRLAVT